MLSGYKTYITSGGFAILAFLKGMGWIDQATYDALLAGLLGVVAVTQRAAVQKVETKVEEVKQVAEAPVTVTVPPVHPSIVR